MVLDGPAWPLVSIVTPSYNQAPFLEETIRSVLLQGYPNLEYIVVDGGSTDDSVEIIRKYEPWLASRVSEKDHGQSDAINKGWRQSHGEIVAWLNSDDTYAPEAIGQAVRFLQNNPTTGMAYSNFCIIDENSQLVERLEVQNVELRDELMANYIPQPTVFMRRDALDAAGMLDEQLHYAMDYDLWIRIAMHHKIQHAAGFWANFRMCSGTKSVSQPEAGLGENLRIVLRHLSDGRLADTVGMPPAEVRSKAYLGAALGYFNLGRRGPALRRLFQCVLSHPPSVAHPLVLRLTAKCLLGENLTAAVRRGQERLGWRARLTGRGDA